MEMFDKWVVATTLLRALKESTDVSGFDEEARGKLAIICGMSDCCVKQMQLWESDDITEEKKEELAAHVYEHVIEIQRDLISFAAMILSETRDMETADANREGRALIGLSEMVYSKYSKILVAFQEVKTDESSEH